MRHRQPEKVIQDHIAAVVTVQGGRVFDNDNGMGYRAPKEGAAAFQYGLGPRPGGGSSDLIGWLPVRITPEMVGKHVAVFLAIEVKQPGKKPRLEQQNFINLVNNAGGIALAATSSEEVTQLKERL